MVNRTSISKMCISFSSQCSPLIFLLFLSSFLADRYQFELHGSMPYFLPTFLGDPILKRFCSYFFSTRSSFAFAYVFSNCTFATAHPWIPTTNPTIALFRLLSTSPDVVCPQQCQPHQFECSIFSLDLLDFAKSNWFQLRLLFQIIVA